MEKQRCPFSRVDPGGASAGPPVVLFPSLAGTVLECRTSPVDGFEPGQRIWMEMSALMAGRRNSETSETKLEFRGLGMGQHSAGVVSSELRKSTHGFRLDGSKLSLCNRKLYSS